MTTLFPVRKPCPQCGKPMKLAHGQAEKDTARYACRDCDDPMHSPAARKWVDGPLKPPEK
jgi:ribosomal protein S27AE